jgi:formate-nitrite transporter family protein
VSTGQSRVARLVLPIEGRDHVKGPPDAASTLVEYGDYECPYCGLAHPIVQEVQRRMGHRLRFAFRHFPLSEIHPHALRAAEAAEAAAAQGKFWPMHDLLYENQAALGDADLARYAGALGLDLQRFVKELAEGVWQPRIREDFLSGARGGVNGTPTFFVNGLRHDGPWDADTLVEALSVPVRACL